MKFQVQTHKNVKIWPSLIEHSSTQDKLEVTFFVMGSNYNNAKLIPKGADDELKEVEINKLVEWAKVVINEQLDPPDEPIKPKKAGGKNRRR
jgi:hypothetical protein